MKKLTDKDAILCVSIEEAIAIRDKFKLDIENRIFKIAFETSKKILLYSTGHWSTIHGAVEFNIIKASKILNKGVSKKELLRRIENLEKVMIDNTEVSVSKMESVEELPEKWCIKMDNQEVIDYCNENGEIPPYSQDSNLFAKFPSVNRCTSISWITEGYTEITFDQFKKWVLKEDDLKPVESDTFEKPDLGNTDTSHTVKHRDLSIREVQVKVSSQEEANECAEIAKACGEKIWEYESALKFNYDEELYFQKNDTDDDFFIGIKEKSLKEISIQEYRERFGKPKDIDWSKANYFKSEGGLIVLSNGNSTETSFEATIVVEDLSWEGYKGKVHTNFSKKYFTLCTEPITLSN